MSMSIGRLVMDLTGMKVDVAMPDSLQFVLEREWWQLVLVHLHVSTGG